MAEADIQALNVRVAAALSTKLVKAIRKFLKQLNSGLMNKFTTHFEEEGGVRRAWNSDLGEDALRAQKECALALAQLILVPQGLNVPGASEAIFVQSQVRHALKWMHDLSGPHLYTASDQEQSAGGANMFL